MKLERKLIRGRVGIDNERFLRGKGLHPYLILPHPALIGSLTTQAVHLQHPRVLGSGVGRVWPHRAAGNKAVIRCGNDIESIF